VSCISMCERAQFCRGICYRPIDTTHKGRLMPEIPRILYHSAEAPCSLVYAFGGNLKSSVRMQIEVTE